MTYGILVLLKQGNNFLILSMNYIDKCNHSCSIYYCVPVSKPQICSTASGLVTTCIITI